MSTDSDSSPAGLAQLATMYSVLSAANEALLYAVSPQELYQRVCNAAVSGSRFLLAAVAIPDANTSWVKVAASAGKGTHLLGNARISVSDTHEEGHGLVGVAARSGQPCVSHDFLNDERTRPWHALATQIGIQSAAAVPFREQGRTLGVLIFYAADRTAFSDEIVALLERMTRNILFALEMFSREEERRRAEIALRRVEENHRSILESLDDPYYEVDLQGNEVYHNDAFSRILGYTPEENHGRVYSERQTPEMAAVLYKAFNEVYRTGISKKNQEWEYLHKNGSRVQVEGSVQLIRDEHGAPVGFRGILRDVTERRRIDQALRDSEERFRALTHLSSDWYWELDSQFRFTRMDSRSGSSSDGKRHPLIGRVIWDSAFQAQEASGWDRFRELTEARKKFRDIVMHRTLSNGKPYYVSLSGEPVFDAGGGFQGYRGISREITDQKVAEEKIHFLARHDVLTGLPNRLMFSTLLNGAIATASRYQRKFAVFFIDLDRFKFINDTLGHEAGDTLLKQLATRFKQTLRASDVLSRLGGDEFVVLVHEVGDNEHAATVAGKMLSATLRPFTLEGQECRVTASIGIAMYPADGEDEQTLMKNADSAMYYAKEEGKNNYQFYLKEINSQSLERLTLENNLRQAMTRDEFQLHYQAKVDLRNGGITGVEALLRWNNAALGVVSPAKFIPVAEETGLIVPIGRWVLRTACEQNVEWQRQGLPPIRMAVNLSVRQFADEGLVRDIAAILADTGMSPPLLELEITEGMIIHNVDRAIKLLGAIKEMGVRLAIDDFGTGYSSLGQLKNFPIDTLKVDRSFIRDLATDSEDKAITSAIIAMGKTLSLTVVAEGVETLEQQNFLQEQSCDEMQGYYFSKPVAADDFATLLRGHHDKR